MAKRKLIECSNGKTYATVAEATKDVRGFSGRNIYRALNGKQPSAYGLRWKYVWKEV